MVDTSGPSEKSVKSSRSKKGKSHVSAKKSKSQTSSKKSKSRASSNSLKSGKKRNDLARLRREMKKKQAQNATDMIVFIHGNGQLFVKESDLVAVSALMKVRQTENRLARQIDLREFSWECLQLLETYISTRVIRANVSFYVIAELLKLTKAFGIEELNKKMETVLISSAMQNGVNLMQALLVNNISPVTRETEMQLHYLGAQRFLDLVRQPDFHSLPAHQFLLVFSSCELNVSHELVAVDAALYYLAGQKNLDQLAPAVFALVRSTYLGKLERQMIVERMQVLNFPGPVIRISKALLESRHNNRICLNPDHIKNHLVRCGVCDLALQPHEITLPLSRPRDGLIRPKEDPYSKKKKKCRSERSGKSFKTRSSKSGRSSKSERSKSTKSSKSSKSEKSGKSKRSCSKSHKSGKSRKPCNSKSKPTFPIA